jgi:hypothetical protein
LLSRRNFPIFSAFHPARQIDCPAPNCRKHESGGRRFAIRAAFPGLKNCLLDEILRIGFTPGLASRKQEKAGRVLFQPSIPICIVCEFMIRTAVHAISRSKRF